MVRFKDMISKTEQTELWLKVINDGKKPKRSRPKSPEKSATGDPIILGELPKRPPLPSSRPRGDEPSVSLKTISGGLPTLGKGHR